jgi:hypothetical protein
MALNFIDGLTHGSKTSHWLDAECILHGDAERIFLGMDSSAKFVYGRCARPKAVGGVLPRCGLAREMVQLKWVC